MRVLMLSNLYPPVVVGGAERYAGTLADRLRERGHKVAAVTLAGGEGPDVVATVAPLPGTYHPKDWVGQPRWRRALFHLDDLYDPRVTRALRTAVDRFAPDVVHSHTVQGLSTAALLAPTRLGCAHVHTLHDYWLLCQRNSLLRRDGTSCQTGASTCRAISALRAGLARRAFADVVLSPSAAVLEAHARFGGFPDDVRVVRHATESLPAPLPRARRDGALTVGYIGQVTAHKGVGTLLDAVAHLRADGLDVELRVAGDGALVPRVRAAPAGVTSLGLVAGEGKEAFFRSIDALVVPSEWCEPAGLVISEAKARRVPVIGSDLGGTPEYVPASCRPLLFPAGDGAALVRSLRTFAEAGSEPFAVVDEDLRPTWDQHLDEVEAAYRTARR